MKALVIPIHRPPSALLTLLDSLPPGEFAAIVVVDDGGAIHALDAELRARGAIVARHAVPVGRGAALRTGIHAALASAPTLDSIVFAEEFTPADAILRIAARSAALTLGARRNSHVNWPARLLAGIRVSDPWAPLRSVPAPLLPHLLALESNGPDFDIETLVAAREHAIPIVEEIAAPSARQAHAPRAPKQEPPPPGAAVPLLRFLALHRPQRAIDRLLAFFVGTLFAAALAAAVYGFATGHLFQQFVWLPWGLRRLVHFASLFGACSLPVLLFIPWAYAALFAALLTGATTLAEGPLAVAAVLFFLLSANSLGEAIAGRLPEKRRWAGSGILHTLLGIGIDTLLMTLTARLPVNYPALWIALLSLPIALDLPGVAHRLRAWLATLRSIELTHWRERGALALLLFVLCIHWLGALEPEYSADGLTMHLAISADIAAHRAMTFRPDLFVWSVMPMAADFAYSIVYLIGGEASASLLNFAFLLSIVAMLYRAVRAWLPRDAALIAAALFASTPLVNLVTGSLFIENFLAAMVLAMAIALWRFHESGARRDLLLAAALGGIAASAKFGACAFVFAALAIAAAEARRRRMLKPALAAAALLAIFAAPPYAIAWAKTGNPVFPFLNARFPSALLERGVEFRNQAFTQPIGWSTPFDLVFHTSRYLEGLNGAFGFQYLVLIPLAAVALFCARQYGARIAAGIALAAGAIVLASQPYARYVYPALPLLTIPFAALAARCAPRHRPLYFGMFAAALLCIALNVYFTPTSGWYHKDLYATAIFHRDGRARIVREDVPLRDVTLRFRQAHPQDHVLLLIEQDLADAGPRAYEDHWHQYGIWKQIAGAGTVAALRNLFTRLGVRYFISRRPGPDDDLLSPSSLAEFMASCTSPILQNGRFYAAETTPECASLSDAALETKLEGLPPATVSAGTYDDFDPALRFHGAWIRSKFFDGPYRHSVSYTASPGAVAAFAFEGSALTYVFTRTFNRGIANLVIDGAAHEIDLYSPATEWQSHLDFTGLGPGRHLAFLRATGSKQAASQDAYIDVDAFVAR